MSNNEMIMLPREVVEQALEALINEGEFRKLLKPLIEKSIDSIRAALEQPQGKLTQQDIADSALLGNIESPFNACMHQENCKAWKEKSSADTPATADLTDDQIIDLFHRKTTGLGRKGIIAFARAIFAAAPQPQSDATPYLYYDPKNGETCTNEAIIEGCIRLDGLIALYAK